MKTAIFWGGTGQAVVIREAIGYLGIRLVALFDNKIGLPSPFSDVPIYYGIDGFSDWLANNTVPQGLSFVVTIGGWLGRDRLHIQRHIEACGIAALTVVHPRSFVASNASLAGGCQILAQSAVCAESHLGSSCIVNTGAVVEHQCKLGDGVHVAPGARVAGCVSIGDFAFVGTGATVLPRVNIGTGAIVGAGAVVLNDVPPFAKVVGNPARIIGYVDQQKADRQRHQHDPFTYP
ncbi:MAG: NeuD/PglB/VioB family sugar acetyltransferase [Caldilinea sp.]|nr:NeuD/PglB/VioB family sugar acetyltransferase [Caldilinea sp.]MCW5841171.1 NeuD/PglB/VioB family sugar acetyltransferase [Caldilinea sp.]